MRSSRSSCLIIIIICHSAILPYCHVIVSLHYISCVACEAHNILVHVDVVAAVGTVAFFQLNFDSVRYLLSSLCAKKRNTLLHSHLFGFYVSASHAFCVHCRWLIKNLLFHDALALMLRAARCWLVSEHKTLQRNTHSHTRTMVAHENFSMNMNKCDSLEWTTASASSNSNNENLRLIFCCSHFHSRSHTTTMYRVVYSSIHMPCSCSISA